MSQIAWVKWGSKEIMNWWEREHPNSFYGDTQMDYHNNLVGREGKYSEFRGKAIADLYNRGGWAINVKDYIDEDENGILMNWETTTSNDIIDTDIAETPETKYVYWYKLSE